MKKFLRILVTGLLAFGAVAFAPAQGRIADVWDFGGVQDENATNHISSSDIAAISTLGDDGAFLASGELSFGDLTVRVDKGDRAYHSGEKSYGSPEFSAEFEDGYTPAGFWYCNGKGGEQRRYLLLKNVNAGDVVTFYAQTSNDGDEKIHFISLDEDGIGNDLQDEVDSVSKKAKRYSYIALASGMYKVYCESSVGKPVYFRITRTPAVQVSGALQSLPSGSGSLTFTAQETGRTFPAKITGKSYTASLPAGFTFTAALSGISGYGVSKRSRTLVIAADAGASLKNDLAIAEQTAFTISGKILGVSAGRALSSDARLVLTPSAASQLPVEIGIKNEGGAYTFSDEIEPSVSYTASLVNANDYELTGDLGFEGTASFTKDITLKLRKTYDVSGKFFGEIKEFPKSVRFRNIEDGSVYDGRVSTLSYSVELRDGTYEVLCETSLAKTVNHIVVDKAPVIKDIKLSLKEKTIRPLPPKRELWVGSKRGQYASVAEAIAAARAMNPLQERERITIFITPGVYRNQLVIDVPYITLKNADPAQQVKLTWYYGAGYRYYSADAEGWYNEDLAYDAFAKNGVAEQGVATYIRAGAKAFRAEGITFESSFNKYVTDEELRDGVEAVDGAGFVRKRGADVRAGAAESDSTALFVEATEAEFVDCAILGNKGTFRTGAGVKGYLRRCFIEGNTDFIAGDGDVVFEDCELRWAGYTDTASQGCITAAQTAEKSKGYLFYSCLISNPDDAFAGAGYFGRPAGSAAAVAWVNTVLGVENAIAPEAWRGAAGSRSDTERLREINTTWAGAAVELSSRPEGTIPQITKDYTVKFYLGQWKPEFYTEPKSAKLKPKKPLLASDDDINAPYPGHTLTVQYSLGASDSDDLSLLKWYRDKDGKSELVKQSLGYADRSYLIQGDDTGGTIRCLIIPQIRSGDKASPIEAKLDKKIGAGYAIPANAVVSRPRIKGSVKLFLASDSTGKDYSPLGMWMGGKNAGEGSWGEFLHSYCNGAVSVQNYAEGSHSSRSFINAGLLDKIEANLARGDYLFIQFGQNDCLTSEGFLETGYVPLGKPDKKGIYPVRPGKRVSTPEEFAGMYGATYYAYDSGGTYKWYLKQYIDVARKVGATPVLVTPVSRQYFSSDGKIRAHLDSSERGSGTQTTENNAYVEAIRQLAKEEKVTLLDGFALTKTLYERAYADKRNDSAAKLLMYEGDSSHSNKLGGFVAAGELARAVKILIPALGKGIVRPADVIGENPDGSVLFTVDRTGKFSCGDEYWTLYTQRLLDSIK